MRRNTRDAAIVDLLAHARSSAGMKPAWSQQGEDLSVNLIVLAAGEGIAEHVNDEVEVLLVGIDGEGTVAVDGRNHALHGGQAVLIPKGARRAIHAITAGVVYLTCHRRRAGLRPVAMAANPPGTETR